MGKCTMGSVLGLGDACLGSLDQERERVRDANVKSAWSHKHDQSARYSASQESLLPERPSVADEPWLSSYDRLSCISPSAVKPMTNTTNPPPLLHAKLTYAIRGVLFDVGNHLGAQLPEADFQQAVSIDLAKRGIAHELEKEFRVLYRGEPVGHYFCDLWVEDKVVVELKVAPEITNRHRAQTLSYVRVTGADVGLLAAFGGRVRIERYANFFAHNRPAFAWQSRVSEDETLLCPELVGQAYECLRRVHYELGPGFLHPIYRNASRLELNAQQFGCIYLHELPVTYEGQYISSRRCFLLILEDKILLAAFAARDYTPARQEAFATQMRRYLNYLGKELGLMANFYGVRLVVTPVRLGEETGLKADGEIHDG